MGGWNQPNTTPGVLGVPSSRAVKQQLHSASHAILIKAIDDEDAQVRFAAMEGCEWKKIVKAVPKLKAALGHGEIAVQEKAARALKVITKRSYEGRIKRPNKE